MRLTLLKPTGPRSFHDGDWLTWPEVLQGRWPNFSPWEFRSRDGAEQLLLDERLLDSLQELRNTIRLPISVNSGYRTTEWNKAIGGERDSQHLRGRAADIVVPRLGVEDLAEWAAKIPAFRDGGIGTYPKRGFVHVDVRDGRARWER